jgi:hypothetical protein
VGFVWPAVNENSLPSDCTMVIGTLPSPGTEGLAIRINSSQRVPWLDAVTTFERNYKCLQQYIFVSETSAMDVGTSCLEAAQPR